ncbi:hypothetical protein GA0070609_4766 [Micromonospora echinaurantiaca]|uniref:Uncharacterized protein n=1 Tax=Micromonospora echinaurantiaca TaxID=47857 RepID=A0A1C5JS51_9ACTN|nr:hypothetical protein [Micromonospora echinaurantiaca]SCG72846.1 hypothetical protein GA0070609_4766 [Micromonospora echinaurantiaca]
MTPDQITAQWLRLVVADAELSPYLIGVDLGRFGAHLTGSLAAALGDGPAAGAVGRDGWCGLGLSEAQHRRIVDRLVGVLWALDLPEERVAGGGQPMIDELCDALRPRLAEDDARLLVAALFRHADTDDPVERAAPRTVLGHAARHFDLRPHAHVIAGSPAHRL